MNSSILNVLSFFFKTYPKRTGIVILFLFLTAIMEGFGIATLLPLISAFSSIGTSSSDNTLTNFINHFFLFFNIKPEIPYLLGLITGIMLIKSILNY